MLTIILITTILAGLLAIGMGALRFGADSRPVFDERREGERFGVLR